MKQLKKTTKRLLLFALAFFSFGYASAQIEVSGKLTDTKGQPLVAASVAELNTNNGTFTDLDGTWSLSVKNADAVLEFSYVGFQTQTIKVGTQRNFRVSLKPDAVVVQTVVKIGYASAKPEDVTGGITQLKGDEVANKPVLAVDQALQGKAAGVQVRANSGTPGAAMDIVVRGRGTVGDARPLYVVDGVPSGYEYRGDPGNIESISILKDASSCAIYGARGANGVILITTKGGNSVGGGEGEYANISFDAYRGIQSPWKKADLMNAKQYAEVLNSNAVKSGQDSVYTAAQIANMKSTDWQDAIFQKAIIEKYKITIDGGSQRSSWSTSGGYLNQEGIVTGSSYQRYDLGYKMMYQLTNKLDFGMGSGFNVNSQDRLPEGNLEQSVLGTALVADPTVPVFDSTGNWSKSNNNSFFNPVGMIDNNHDTEKGFGLGANVWANYKVMKGLEFRSQYNYGKWGNNREQYFPIYEISSSQRNDRTRLKNTIQEGHNWGVTNTLTYTYNINDKIDSTKVKHGFRFLVGHEALYEYQEAFVTEIQDMDDVEAMRYIIAGNTESGRVWAETWQAPSEHTMLSYIGRIEYAFDDKYLTNFTVRRDGSSRFGAGRKYGVFPSVGVAWKVNKEPFFYNNEWLRTNVTLFKMRGGYGKIGNENIQNYGYVSSVINDVTSRYSFGKTIVPAAVPFSVPNEELHWEEATSWNVGTDISLWKNKLMFNFDYFIKNNVENLLRIEVPAVVGIDGSNNNPLVNTGKINNKGYEVSLLYRNTYKADSSDHTWKYDVSFNFTQIKNNVTYLAESELPGGYIDNAGVYAAYTKEGYPIASFFGYKVDGIFQSWEEINAAAQPAAVPGDYKFVDVNGDGQINAEDITFLGSPHPDFTYGLSANLGYRGFDLGLSFQGVYGNMIFNSTKYYLDGGFLNSNLSTRRLDVWSADNKSSDQPTDPTWFSNKEKSFPHSEFIEDGSYLRLKNITLGYTLPDALSAKAKLNQVRVYGQIQNALTFTKYSGFDPEIGTNEDLNWRGPEFGVDRGVYPQARSVVFGVNLQF